MVAWVLATTFIACVGITTRQVPPPPQSKIDAATLYGLRIYHSPLDIQGGRDLVFNVCLTTDGAIERVEYSANMQQEAALHLAEKITRSWSYQAYVPPGQTKGVAVCGLIAPEEFAALDRPKPTEVHAQPLTHTANVNVAASSAHAVTASSEPAPDILAPKVFEQLRIAGSILIAPDDATATQMQRLKVSTVRVGVKLCLAADGKIASTSILTSSGFGNYDRRIFNTIRSTWKYRPFTRNGAGLPVCTVVTFVYSQ